MRKKPKNEHKFLVFPSVNFFRTFLQFKAKVIPFQFYFSKKSITLNFA